MTENELTSRSGSRILVFIILGFFPIGLALLPLIWGFTINLLVDPFSPASLASGVSELILLGGVAGIIYGAFRLSEHKQSFISRWLTLYLAWLVISALAIFLGASALAGVSMAVVEGVVKGRQLTNQVLTESARFLVMSQVFTLPWTLFAAWLYGRVEQKRFPIMTESPISKG